MSIRIDHLAHEFVTYIPDELEPGIVYASLEYRIAVHLCCCGCGERVVTPLDPAQWSLTFDGQAVSLNPSIAGGRCDSHYYITRGRVRWARTLTVREKKLAAQRDQSDLEGRYGTTPYRQVETPSDPGRGGWWTRLWRRVKSRQS